MDGYTSQYQRLEERQVRPSEFRAAVDKLRPAELIDDVVVIVDPEPEQKVLGS
jgi:hypothetical protein